MRKARILLCGALLVSSLFPTFVKANNRVEDILNSMTLEQKISQMLMPDFRKWQQETETKPNDVTEMNSEIREVIDKYRFGGVILFAENVKQTEQTLRLTHELQMANNLNSNGKIPLLLTIDQEGGIVYRLGSGTALPGNMALGATRDNNLAREAGEIIGRELQALGINTNFAPVFDVNNNPHNPVIGLRSFSSDPKLVGELGVSLMKGIQNYNVATAAKHFPGHGDTAVDSHTGLPLVNKSKAELLNNELLAFKYAIDNGVDMLMTAHIQYPQLEKDTVVSKLDGSNIYVPATLSDDIIRNVVRKELGYDGIVVSDAMGMDAISKHFGEVEAVLMAIKADVDILLMPTVLRSKKDLAKLDTIINSVKTAVQSGEIDVQTINNSVRRILKLKEKRGILDYFNNSKTLDEKIAYAKATVGSEKNREIERNIAASAVTVVKNENNVLPFNFKENEKVLLLGAYNNELPGMELAMRRLIAEGKIPASVNYETFRYSSKTDFDSELKPKIDEAKYVIVVSEIGRESHMNADNWLTKIPTSVIKYANEKNIDSVVMSISKPYDVANYPEAKAIVAVYGNKGMDPTESLKPDFAFGPNISAGIEVIAGRSASGRLPVDVMKVKDGALQDEIAYPIGYGLSYANPQKTFNLKYHQNTIVNESYTIAIPNNFDSLEAQNYSLKLKYDATLFDVEGGVNGELTLTKNNLNVKVKPLKAGNHQFIQQLTLTDFKGKTYELNHDTLLMSKLKSDNIDHTTKQTQINTTTKKAVDTADNSGNIALLFIISLFGLVVITKKQS